MLNVKLPSRQGRTTEQRSGLGGSLAGATGPDRPASPAGPVDETPRRWRDKIKPRGHDPEGLTTTWSSGSRLATRALAAAVVMALVSGPAHVAYDFFVADEPAAVVAPQTGEDQRKLSRRLVASEAAVQWVQTWASATESTRESLGERWSGSAVILPAKASTVSSVRVVDAVASAPGVWSVTVAAQVTDPGQDPAQRYYQVPVQVAGNEPGQITASPQSVPAIVPGPGAAANVDRGDYGAAVGETSAAGQTISQFLAALLTGEGQIDRYVTPGAPIVALPEESRYASVRVSSIRSAATGEDIDWQNAPKDGATVEVLVDATVATDDEPKTGRSVSYPLLLTARGGRWEVTSIQPRLADTSTSTEGEDNSGQSADPTTGETP